MDKLQRHRRQDPEPIENFRKDIPPGLSAVLGRMLAKRPQERFRTPDSVALALVPYTRGDKLKSVFCDEKAAALIAPAARRLEDTPLPLRLADVQIRRAAPRTKGTVDSTSSRNLQADTDLSSARKPACSK
jgi:hypothetical protein